jgi:dolichol-phosphate mannosyltransferase
MISLVIPTYNEAANLTKLIPRIHQALRGNDYRILIVDDNSPDGTADVAEKLGKKYSVEVLRRPKKEGLGAAYVAGFTHALKSKPDFVFSMDADLSHDPKYLPSFMEASKKFDVVIGSRYVPGGGVRNWNLRRRLTSRFGNMFARAMLGLTPRDVSGSYRCYRANVLKAIDLSSIKSSGYSFPEEMLYRCVKQGASMGEVPIIFPDRKVGKSKLGKKEAVNFVFTMLKLRFSRK